MLGDRSLSGHEGNELFRNEGGRFTRIGWASGAMSKLDGRGFVPADFDRDGDLDLFVFNNVQPCVYLRNDVGVRGDATSNGWCVVQLRGDTDNHFGVGARIRVTAGGTTQLREMRLGSGYLSGSPLEAHFGLGDARRIDHLEVVWPNGEMQEFEGLAAGRIWRVNQGEVDVQDVSVVPKQPASAGGL